MNPQLTNEELTNLLALTARAQITGQEATTVAILQQKLRGLINPIKKEEQKNDGIPRQSK